MQDLNIKKLSIIFHCGEPMMQPMEDFIYLTEKLLQIVPRENLELSIQTNATLVTSKWINLFNKYKVQVGVSIDSPQEYHDKYEIDHYGNSSHERVERSIKLLQQKLKTPIGFLIVINPEFNSKKIYRYLVGLGVYKMDFLLPDNNHKFKPTYSIKDYAKYLIDLFEEWIFDDNPQILIRTFHSLMLQLIGKSPLIYGFGKNNQNNNHVLSIRSDGEVSVSQT